MEVIAMTVACGCAASLFGARIFLRTEEDREEERSRQPLSAAGHKKLINFIFGEDPVPAATHTHSRTSPLKKLKRWRRAQQKRMGNDTAGSARPESQPGSTSTPAPICGSNITMEGDDLCPICLTEMKRGEEMTMTHCAGKHCYHRACFLIWVTNHHTCPLCSEDLNKAALARG
ncbi:unnamed protein product [Chrysoparadoxa australica]